MISLTSPSQQSDVQFYTQSAQVLIRLSPGIINCVHNTGYLTGVFMSGSYVGIWVTVIVQSSSLRFTRIQYPDTKCSHAILGYPTSGSREE